MVDPQKLSVVLDKVLPFARAAETIAQRLVGKVRTLSLFGLAAALWLAYACYIAFELSLAATVPIAVVLLVAPLVLLRAAAMLGATIGLSQRITDTVGRLVGKANEYRELYNNRLQAAIATKPTLRQLWSAGKSLLEVKGLSDEAREVVALTGGALAIANPLFAVLLTIASTVTVLIVAVAAAVGIAHLI